MVQALRGSLMVGVGVITSEKSPAGVIRSVFACCPYKRTKDGRKLSMGRPPTAKPYAGEDISHEKGSAIERPDIEHLEPGQFETFKALIALPPTNHLRSDGFSALLLLTREKKSFKLPLMSEDHLDSKYYLEH